MKLRKIISLVVILAIIGFIIGGFLYYQNNKELQKEVYRSVYPSFCDNPIVYRIGTVDQQFQLPRQRFEKLTADASDIWNKAYGEKLFIVDPNAKLTVNLVFDERQKLTNELNTKSSEINNAEGDLKPTINSYEKSIQDFQNKVKGFDEKVKYWNDRGGAPEEEYNKLIEEQKGLQQESENLAKKGKELNVYTSNFNSKVKDFNETITEFNSTLKTNPEEGIFDGGKNSITIYYYLNDDEIIHTLGHEFGHALGIKHVNNPNALMYAKTNKTAGLTESDTLELQKACARTPIWEILRDRYFQ